ncbi:uncharacterized protein LOC133815387 [Humulus lupulus]|uniref:uncharacterized protein LOC133815387 n=1 Tax=Humulus lupulus TaxID=3486 RepID=UPI002B414C58|nr:uncharacterized protein LOC133815387 [Humulus lupulus]
MNNFRRKQEETKIALAKWNQLHFKALQVKISLAKEKLTKADTSQANDYDKECTARRKLNEALQREEIHRNRNQGFTSPFDSLSPGLEGVLQNIITEEQNEILASIPDEEEIKAVLEQINPDKAPGPDGLLGSFYRHHWKVVRNGVLKMVKSFFEESLMPPFLNIANLVLILKKENASSAIELRAIALCNVAYKIISKILANGLRPILPDIVSQLQFVFVKGGVIQDNTMIVNEVIHTMNKSQGKQDVLSRLLSISENQGMLKGIKVAREAPAISHLVFADDIILFGKATQREAKGLMDCLNKYCDWLGEKINMNKLEFHFSNKVNGSNAIKLADYLRMN